MAFFPEHKGPTGIVYTDCGQAVIVLNTYGISFLID